MALNNLPYSTDCPSTGGRSTGTIAFPTVSSRRLSRVLAIAMLILICHAAPSLGWQRLAAIVPSTSVVALASDQHPTGETGDLSMPPSIDTLINQLNSRDFAIRESATEDIIDQGDAALPLLAERFFDRSPETNYRIRKALEGIASAGDEETFLRAAAILMTLYANGNDKIFQQIAELKTKWQTIRTQNVIQALRRTGAEVTQKNGYANFRGEARQVIIRAPQTNEDREPLKQITIKRTAQQQRQRIKAILNESTAGNREFVFNAIPEQPPANLRIALGLTNLDSVHLAGTTIKFPSHWADENNDDELLADLNHIDDRLIVDVENASFSASQWDAFSNAENIAALNLTFDDTAAPLPDRLPRSLQTLTLQGLELNGGLVDALQGCPKLQQLILKNCRFNSDRAEQINECDSLKNIVCHFENTELTPDQVSAMAPLKNLKSLHLDSIKLSLKTVLPFRDLKSVSVLYVSNTTATKEFFFSVGDMVQLKTIQFKGCKLDIAAFKSLEKRGGIRMNFEAQAFLGIQGSGPGQPGQPPSGDTMVSMVIPDSAAQQGGIVAGDFINKIQGEKVESFNDVRLLITQFAAGDEVEIEVLRNGQPKSLTVTLRDFKTARKF